MFVLGLQGSPRANGSTSLLLSAFLAEAESIGGKTCNLEVAKKKITPCQNCGTCEREGYCPIDDDMNDIYPLLRRADIIVMATPIFFYGTTAQMKSLIDRSQVMWSRKYVHNLSDPGRKQRKGFLLSLGATKGKNLFEGVNLTAKYFFDAVGASFEGSLTYHGIEGTKDIIRHPAAISDTKKKARELIEPLLKRKKILFICRENACRSQMASAFTRYHMGDKIEAGSAGSQPAGKINKIMMEVMEELGIDMAFFQPKSIEETARDLKPDLIVSMGCEEGCPYFPDVPIQDWNLPDPSGKPIEFMRKVRDEILDKLRKLY